MFESGGPLILGHVVMSHNN